MAQLDKYCATPLNSPDIELCGGPLNGPQLWFVKKRDFDLIWGQGHDARRVLKWICKFISFTLILGRHENKYSVS